jgi:hypothetical protein
MDLFLFFCLEEGGSGFLRNSVTFTPDYVMSHARKQPSANNLVLLETVQ